MRHLGYQFVDEDQKITSAPEGTDLVIGTPEQLALLIVGPQAGRHMAYAGSLRDGWITTSPFGEGGPDGPGSGAAKLWRYYLGEGAVDATLAIPYSGSWNPCLSGVNDLESLAYRRLRI